MKTHNIELDVLLQKVDSTALELTRMSRELQQLVDKVRQDLPDDDETSKKP